jgi:hypothetical protein
MLTAIYFKKYFSRLLSKNVKIKMCKTIILSVVLYGCKIWSLILRKEYRLRVFEDRVLRKIFGPKRSETIGDWKELHNEELHNLYSSPNKIRMIKSRRMRRAGLEVRMGENRNSCRILVAKPEGKGPLGSP